MWYEQQDQSLIKSSRKEVMLDIRQVASWTYGSKFCFSPEKKDEVCFGEADADLVQKQHIPSARKLVFLLILLEKAGMNAIAAWRLGEIIGVSRMTIHKNLNRLEKEGVINRIHRTAFHNEDGSFYQPKNIYQVCDSHKKKTQHDNIGKNMVVLVETLLSSFADVYEQVMMETTSVPGKTHLATLRERHIE